MSENFSGYKVDSYHVQRKKELWEVLLFQGSNVVACLPAESKEQANYFGKIALKEGTDSEKFEICWDYI